MPRTSSSDYIEQLEIRRLLSGTRHLGRVLTVNGDNDAADTIVIGLNQAGDKVQVTINGGEAKLFDRARVKHIIVRARSGNDTITIDENNGALGKVRTFIDAGDGNDTVRSGSGNDLILGRKGDDDIDDTGGNNFIHGDDGNDRIVPRDGDDWVSGGRGNDFIDGWNGRNFLAGGLGDDTIAAGEGNDFMDGGRGNDS